MPDASAEGCRELLRELCSHGVTQFECRIHPIFEQLPVGDVGVVAYVVISTDGALIGLVPG